MARRKKVNNDAIKYNYDDKGNIIQLEAIENRTVQSDGRIHTNKIMVEGTLAKPKKILSALNPTTMNYVETSGAIAQDNQYKVDYVNGDVYFHNSQIGTEIQSRFMFIGEKLGDASEIYASRNSDGTVTKNLTEDFEELKNKVDDSTNSVLDVANEVKANIMNVESQVNVIGTDIIKLNNNKVDKVVGKSFSTNDYTNEDKGEVSKIKNKADTEFVISKIAEVKSATPVFVGSTSQMTDSSKIYCHTGTGQLWYHNGTNWVNSNILYQSTGINSNSLNTSMYQNNSVSIHKLMNPQVPIVTKTITHDVDNRVLKLVHPTYITIDNLIEQKVINVTTQDIEFDLSPYSINLLHLIVYDYATKIISIKPVTTKLTDNDKILFYYYKGEFIGINSNMVSTQKTESKVFGIKEIVEKYINYPFRQNVKIKFIGDSLTAGVGATGYGLTSEPISNSGKFVPKQDSNSWANIVGSRISSKFKGETVIPCNSKEIVYDRPTTFTLNRTKYIGNISTESNYISFYFKIKASNFKLFFTKQAGSSIVEIFVDGNSLGQTDLYNATEINSFEIPVNGLLYDEHIVEVKYVGKNPSSVSSRVYFEGIKINRNVSYKNMGVSGVDTTWVNTYASELVASDDDLVIMQIGTNDRIRFQNVGGYKSHLTNIVDYILSQGKNLILVVPPPSVPPEEETKNFKLSEVNAIMKQVATEYGVDVVDHSIAINDYIKYRGVGLNSLYVDGLHLNDTGYFIEADNFMNKLEISW